MGGDVELETMGEVLAALERLEGPARARVIKWVAEKLNVAPVDLQRGAAERVAGGRKPAEQTSSDVNQFRDFADLFDAARPETDVEKALVAAYWVQVGCNNADFGSQSINAELKQLGYPVGNITRALDGLIQVRPALVQQLRKDGGSKQARKTYRVTHVGLRRVEQMCSGEEAG